MLEELLQSCWEFEPIKRPSFSQVFSWVLEPRFYGAVFIDCSQILQILTILDKFFRAQTGGPPLQLPLEVSTSVNYSLNRTMDNVDDI